MEAIQNRKRLLLKSISGNVHAALPLYRATSTISASRRDGAGALQAVPCKYVESLSGFDGSARTTPHWICIIGQYGSCVRQVLNAEACKNGAHRYRTTQPLAELAFNLTEPPIPASIAQRLKTTRCWITTKPDRIQRLSHKLHSDSEKYCCFAGRAPALSATGSTSSTMGKSQERRLVRVLYALEVASGQMYLYSVRMGLPPRILIPTAFMIRIPRYVVCHI